MRKLSLVYLVLLITQIAVLWMPAAASQEVTYVFDLTGDEVVPGPGDPDGSGTVVLTVNGGNETSICFDIQVENVAPLTKGDILVGDPGENGPVLIDLFDPMNPGTSKCPYQITKSNVKALLKFPERLYLEVYNEEFPDGALRGQLPPRK